MKIREALVEALLDGWETRQSMIAACVRASVLLGKPLPNPTQADDLLPYYSALRVNSFMWGTPVRSWLEDHHHTQALSRALWDGRPREVCQSIGLRALKVGGKLSMSVRLKVRARELDKKHDWKTVK